MKISTLDNSRCHLGEGPVWDEQQQALYWVDCLAPCVFRHDWATRSTRRWDLSASYIGSLAVRSNEGLILAMDKGFYTYCLSSGDCRMIASPLVDVDPVKFNDGKVDRAGRFVSGGVCGSAGTKVLPRPNAPMIALNVGFSTEVILEEFLCFNGPCFSPSGDTLYVNGRGDMRTIEAMPYDVSTGAADQAAGRVLISDINPDGATVDAAGFLWAAQWTDSCILRVSPNGEIDRRIALDGHVVSSVMFGGPNLDILFATTLGQPFWNTVPMGTDPGPVLVIEYLGYRGLPEPRFAG